MNEKCFHTRTAICTHDRPKNKTQRREEVESETQKMGRREGEKEEKRGRRCRRRRFSEKQ